MTIRFCSLYLLLGTIAIAACGQSKSKKNTAAATMADSSLQMPATPDEIYGDLFEEVQMQRIFPDGKTFVDAIPRRNPRDIMYDYGLAKGAALNLRQFVNDNFILPETPSVDAGADRKAIVEHINQLWPLLTRQPDSVRPGSSLLPLPHPYIVPGGRFREIYYWDSYFTMLGLRESGQTGMIENMVSNFAYLIRTYGHIPNGNRSYYLSRSQPPFFSLMVSLLAEIRGDEVLKQFGDAVEKEYLYWMEGDRDLQPGQAFKRVVKMPGGELMNRYWDDRETPRQESYREDVETAEASATRQMAAIRFASPAAADSFRQQAMRTTWRHLRAGAASGWDFSSRWLEDAADLSTVETADIIPVDLNCLLWHSEQLIAKIHRLQGRNKQAENYAKWAREREEAINRYCYNEAVNFYTDYHFDRRQPMDRITAAGLFPFCFFEGEGYRAKATSAAVVVREKLLANGGLLTTPVASGQQWDAPNGWAPLQWMAVWGLAKSGQAELAADIARRWLQLNEAVYARTGKLMEKYNVVNTQLEAGGGEYPGQDGFGWTNGVYLALRKLYPATSN